MARRKLNIFYAFFLILAFQACQVKESSQTKSEPIVYSSTNEFGTLSAIVREAEDGKPLVSFKINSTIDPTYFMLIRFRSDSPFKCLYTPPENTTQEAIYLFTDNGLGEFVDDDSDPNLKKPKNESQKLTIGEKYQYHFVPVWTGEKSPPGFNETEARTLDNPEKDSLELNLGLKVRRSFCFSIHFELR